METRVRFVRAQDEAETVVVARQPILDHLERIVAFELLTPQDDDPRQVTASVLTQAIADIGLAQARRHAAGARGRHA